MNEYVFSILIFCELVIFLAAVFMHLVKKNADFIILYAVQSVAVVCIIFLFSLVKGLPGLTLSALLTLLVKGILAPMFFFRLISRNKLKFAASTYLNLPLTFFVVMILIVIAKLTFVSQVASVLSPERPSFLFLSLGTIFISLFMIINRKSAISQIIGTLSLENAIVSFASFIGLEHSFVLELGITFDLVAWIIIASVFISMIQKHFGTLDITVMKNLKE